MSNSHISSSRTRIKICGITREQDLDAAVEAGADAIGLVMYPQSPRALSPQRAGELTRRLPPFVCPVLLFVNPTRREVDAACTRVPNATLQFHGDESPEFCASLDRPFIKAARIPLGPVGLQFDLLEYVKRYAFGQAILLDAAVEGFGGGGKPFDWSLLYEPLSSHLILSGGLDANNVTQGITKLRAFGLSLAVDVSSGVEATDAHGKNLKGVKDAHKIKEFVAAVKAAQPLI
jgi:phosphoribosylanthranilate isomerase